MGCHGGIAPAINGDGGKINEQLAQCNDIDHTKTSIPCSAPGAVLQNFICSIISKETGKCKQELPSVPFLGILSFDFLCCLRYNILCKIYRIHFIRTTFRER